MMNHRCHFCCPGCCISFCSYIKPQPWPAVPRRVLVVYRSIPTSNRNLELLGDTEGQLYIVLFLHQTATIQQGGHDGQSCISFYSYIKPQLSVPNSEIMLVVYRSIPTSNRNHNISLLLSYNVVYRSIPTSNRNYKSNHNS